MIYSDNHTTLYNKSCVDMSEMSDESVQCVPTSPPYWGLRKYSGEQELIWGDKDCEHQWGNQILTRKFSNYNEGFNERWGNPSGDKKQEAGMYQQHSQGNFCSLCGAWKGAYGLEPQPDCGRPFMKLRDDLTPKQRYDTIEELKRLGVV